ncbi:uncharacterized protein PHACADRAFT_147924 [Phanerochaete carnosa HHB-10118-sp]|uniref:Fungal-type protein kinase domain-containing protein n=1 Tax=Phanerochaete carnosa (strain HHB-10118-sp) TaxID=650164 RepID=K5VPL9_PHACS|nr:uncharacterized protein PHACADRAFT_147924 [Phanerochaete carnosa HHB-10118-sp]EKM53388.1 hypothetical protein PHACADRAFT_147924 [Phanerochaete carnosa HHB-10118-sp]
MWNIALEGTGYIVKDTADRIEDVFADHKPDLSLNYDGGPGKDAWIVEALAARGKKKNGDRFRHIARVAMAWSVALVEVKVKSTEDPFGPEEGFDWQRGSRDSRVQILKYVAEIFLRQHRESFCMVFIAGKQARLTRWDRCGVVITNAFDWTTNVAPLVNFFYKIATSSRAMQGFDTSFSWATEAEKTELLQYKDHLREQRDARRLKFVEAMTENQNLYPIYRLNCTATVDGPEHSFAHEVHKGTLTLLVGKYHACNYSSTGRGTKGYFAYVVGKRRLVFLKLSWRPGCSDIPPEHETYERLYEKKVEHIPQLLSGEDICHVSHRGLGRRLSTRTQEFLQSPTPLRSFAYRLVIEILGLPLAEYRNSFVMVRVVSHAVIAHRQAWDGAGILHRDISSGNILIELDSADDEKPNGLLGDWDLSKLKDGPQKATQIGRSGTWAFMSGLSLHYPLKPQEVSDDLESFVNVIYFNTLRFHHHNMTGQLHRAADTKTVQYSEQLAMFVSTFFLDESRYQSVRGTHRTGGRAKMSAYSMADLPFALTDSTDAGDRTMFEVVLKALHSLCYLHYHFVDFDELERYRPAPLKDDQAEAPKSKRNTTLIEQYATRFSANGSEITSKPPSDPLATHSRIEDILTVAGDDPEPWSSIDKTPDQFEHLPTLTLVSDKQPSFTFFSAPRESSASHRIHAPHESSTFHHPIASHSPDQGSRRRLREDEEEIQGSANKKVKSA